jgi:hypothetical protein
MAQFFAPGQEIQLSCTYETTGALLVEVGGLAPAPDHEKEPKLILHLGLVLDLSGSMSAVMPLLNKIVHYLASSVPDHFQVSIVTFADDSQVYFAKTTMNAPGKVALQSLLSGSPLRAHGMTNLSQALWKALDQAKDSDSPFLVLLSDGQPTAGLVKTSDILASVQLHPAFKKTTFFSVALGDEPDFDLLQQLSSSGGNSMSGKFYHVQNEDQLPRVFGDCLGSLLSICATRLLLELELERSAETEPLRISVLNFPKPVLLLSRENQIEIKVGTLYENETRSFLFEIEGANQCSAIMFRLRYQEVTQGLVKTFERRMPWVPIRNKSFLVQVHRLRFKVLETMSQKRDPAFLEPEIKALLAEDKHPILDSLLALVQSKPGDLDSQGPVSLQPRNRQVHEFQLMSQSSTDTNTSQLRRQLSEQCARLVRH